MDVDTETGVRGTWWNGTASLLSVGVPGLYCLCKDYEYVYIDSAHYILFCTCVSSYLNGCSFGSIRCRRKQALGLNKKGYVIVEHKHLSEPLQFVAIRLSF